MHASNLATLKWERFYVTEYDQADNHTWWLMSHNMTLVDLLAGVVEVYKYIHDVTKHLKGDMR